MKSLWSQALAVCLSGMLAALPVLGLSPQGLVGVAQGMGTIQINGHPFGGHASLFSGDRFVTGTKSPLMMISSAAEQMRFEPGTQAQLSKKKQATTILLHWGAVDLRTAGETQTALPGGISVSPMAGQTPLVRVSRLTSGNDEVAVYKGSVIVADASESVNVTAGHTAVVGPNGTGAQSNQSNDKNNRKKKMWAIFITSGLSAGAVAAILAYNQTNFVGVADP